MAAKKARPNAVAARKTAPAGARSAHAAAAGGAPCAAAHGGASPMRVRMYRQGLGDCFLITFPAEGGRNFYMLIDCGVVLGTQQPESIMTKLVEDIVKTTGGNIDLLVATHEHWDHLSGFVQVRDFTKKIRAKQVWLAWTEDPNDKLARKLRAERRAAENALRMGVNRLAAAGASETALNVDSLVGFFGAKTGSTEDALNVVKSMAGGKPRYCQPGEPPIGIDGLPGVRFWILGPPKDEALIKKSNPGTNEAYGLDAGPKGSQAFLISALTRGMGAGEFGGFDDSTQDPFEDTYSIPMARAEHIPFFATRYHGECCDGSLWDKKGNHELRDQSWRRIDASWLEGAETMALQLDSATNNTSLVIAIERTDTGEIFLFPGDAQAGNWLSWQDLKWTVPDAKTGKDQIITGPDLLARTIFYKVGHHGSHNATLKAKGLELMVNDGLSAMIPVDHAMAVKKRWGKMPLPELVETLRKKTHGRMLKVDDKVKAPADLATLRPDGPDAKDWQKFADRVGVTDLYYELSF
jgi:beta-lactamase superfamily II metal-dependent hydrolase